MMGNGSEWIVVDWWIDGLEEKILLFVTSVNKKFFFFWLKEKQRKFPSKITIPKLRP